MQLTPFVLQAEAETNVSLRVLPVEGSGGESFEVQARGELQLGLLIGGWVGGWVGNSRGCAGVRVGGWIRVVGSLQWVQQHGELQLGLPNRWAGGWVGGRWTVCNGSSSAASCSPACSQVRHGFGCRCSSMAACWEGGLSGLRPAAGAVYWHALRGTAGARLHSAA